MGNFRKNRLPQVLLSERQLRHRANVKSLKFLAGKVVASADVRIKKRVPLNAESDAVHILSGVANNQSKILQNEAGKAVIVAASAIARQKVERAKLAASAKKTLPKKKRKGWLKGYKRKIPLRTPPKI